MVVKFISPLLLTIPPLQLGSTLFNGNQIGFNLLKRYQYTLSYPRASKSFQSKSNKKKLKRSSCTFQSANSITNPSSHTPLIKNRKKKMYRYPSMPRVDSTHGINLIDLHNQVLLNGYRPLSVIQEGFVAPHDNNSSTMYEVSLDLNHFQGINPQNNIWMNSATGVEKYGEWDGIPLHVVNKLKPFVPPEFVNMNIENSNDTIDIHGIDPHGLLKQIYEMIYKNHGKKKNGNSTQNIILSKKKK
ncbi:protein Pet20p, mitochondrial [Monosporozyma unispora]|nr:petite colonies protein [Kazachstania unispora]